MTVTIAARRSGGRHRHEHGFHVLRGEHLAQTELVRWHEPLGEARHFRRERPDHPASPSVEFDQPPGAGRGGDVPACAPKLRVRPQCEAAHQPALGIVPGHIRPDDEGGRCLEKFAVACGHAHAKQAMDFCLQSRRPGGHRHHGNRLRRRGIIVLVLQLHDPTPGSQHGREPVLRDQARREGSFLLVRRRAEHCQVGWFRVRPGQASLRNVREFVGDQAAASRRIRRVAARREHEVVPSRESSGPERLGSGIRMRIGVNTHPGKILAETAFHAAACFGTEGLAFLDRQGRRCGRSTNLGRQPRRCGAATQRPLPGQGRSLVLSFGGRDGG